MEFTDYLASERWTVDPVEPNERHTCSMCGAEAKFRVLSPVDWHTFGWLCQSCHHLCSVTYTEMRRFELRRRVAARSGR
jgi:hypothetical protein